MSIPYIVAAALAVFIPLELWRAHRPDEERDRRWAHDRDLELTPENRLIVARYLRNARVLRTWGAVAGAVLPSLIEVTITGRVQVLGFGTDGESAPLGFGTIFVGYLAGALYAEVSLARPVVGARRSASLARRELRDYLARRVILTQRALAGAGALGLVGIAVAPYDAAISNASDLSLVLVGVGGLAACAGLEAIERWLVRRPQPYTSAPMVAADDAIRAQSIHSVAGAGVSLLALLCCGAALGLQASEVGLLEAVMVVPAVVCFLLALLACREIGHGPWRVQRPARATASA